MPRRHPALCPALVLVFAVLAALLARGTARSVGPEAALRRRAVQTFAGLPLHFEPRPASGRGPAEFVTRGPGYSMLLRGPEALIAVTPHPSPVAGHPLAGRRLWPLASRLSPTLVRMRLAGANPSPRAAAVDRLPTTLNYFLGKDPKQWRTGVHPYGKVKYAGVYPGVDLVYYGNQQQLEYDLVVQPGAAPERIALDFSGAEDARLDPETGDLVLQTAAGDLRQHRPIAYQLVGGERVRVPCEYRLEEISHKDLPLHPTPHTPHPTPYTHTPTHPHISFALGVYDRRRALVIDPAISYGSYITGLDTAGDRPTDMALGPDGIAYVTGAAASFDFPGIPLPVPAFQPKRSGNSDTFVLKINTLASGAASLLSGTFLGGSGDEGSPNWQPGGNAHVALDASGSVWLTGWTTSNNFPTTAGALRSSSAGGKDAFLCRIDLAASGAAQLLYSTYLGGNGDDAGTGLQIDPSGFAYVAGNTMSQTFPVTSSGFQRFKSNALNAGFLVKIDPSQTGSAALLYGTYFNGNADVSITGLAVDSGATAYLAGTTASTNLPLAGDPFQASDPNPSQSHAFLARLDTAASGGASLLYSTYIGGSGTDSACGVALEPGGLVVVGGTTRSYDFPYTPGAYQRFTRNVATSAAFVMKIDPNRPAQEQVRYSTVIMAAPKGNNQTDSAAYLIRSGSGGSVWMTGGVGGNSILPVTQDAFLPCDGGTWGAPFITCLNGTLSSVVYSSGHYAGAEGFAVDEGGSFYTCGYAGRTVIPTTGGFMTTNQEGGQNGGGGGYFLKFVPDAPRASSGLTAEAPAGRKIVLKWTDNSTNEAVFKIQRKTGSGAFESLISVPADTTTYTDTGLTPGTNYSYRVQAYNAGGESPFSNTASATARGDRPITPTDLTITAVTWNQVDLKWTDRSVDESSYEIERKTGSGSFILIGAVGANSTTYSDQTVQPKTAYTYRVRAVNSVAPSDYSNEVSASTPPHLPARPTGVTARSRSKSEIELRWDRVDAVATRILVERKTGTDNFQQVTTLDAGAVSYVDGGLQPDTAYIYQLRAANDDGVSDPSNPPVSARTDRPTVPAAPSELSARAVSSPRAIELTWTDNSTNETGFRIERRSTTGDFVVIDTAPAHDGTGTVRHTDPTAQPGTTYTYRVSAVNGDGESSASNEASAKIPTPPAAPELTAALTGPATAHLAWSDVSDEERYRIERQAGGAAFAPLTTVGANQTGYDDPSLAPSTTYTYRVVAVNSGGESAPSNTAAVTTLIAPPTAPSNLQAYVASSAEVGLLWQDGSTTETGFALERKAGSGDFQPLAQLGPNVESYADQSVQPGTTYVYRVQAVNSGGGSDYATSNPVSTPDANDVRPVAPINLRAVGLADRIQLTWEYRGTGHTGFLVERGTTFGSYSTLAVVDASARKYEDRDGLQANTTYFYQVRALGPGGQSDPARADAKVNGGGLYISPSGETVLDFGSIRRGTSRTKSVTIQNLGTSTATVQITRPASPFSVTNPKGTTFKVSGGQTKTVTVQFKPPRKGSFSATLTLKWVEQSKSYGVKLQGKGL